MVEREGEGEREREREREREKRERERERERERAELRVDRYNILCKCDKRCVMNITFPFFLQVFLN